MTIKPFLAALALVASQSAPAFATTYTCALDPANEYDLMPEFVVVDHNVGAGKVTVLDPWIKHFMGGPIEGKLSVDNARRTTFKWTIEGMSIGRYYLDVDYRLTVQKGRHTAQLNASIRNYTNTYHAEGNCEVKN